MENLHIHILFFAEIIFLLGVILFFALRFYISRKYHLATVTSFKQMKEKDIPLFYSSYYIRKLTLFQLFRRSPKIETVLAITAIKNLKKALPKVRKELKKSPQNISLKLLLAQMSYADNDLTTARHLLTQITLPYFMSALQKASYYYLRAAVNFYTTDMDSASKDCSNALKIFRRHDCPYEQAECYLILAQIYRMCGFMDIAFTMLKEAEKIYTSLQLTGKTAEIQAYIGLLELNRENYDVAQSYFTDALKPCPQKKFPELCSNIHNWLGLVYYLKSDLAKSKQSFKLSFELSSSDSVKSLSAEMSARIAMQQKHFSQALKQTEMALQLNQKQHHSAGIFETLYLKAEIYFAQEKYAQSSQILAELIKHPAPAKTTYYPANAYTLLGLINLQKNDLNKATSYFKQAIDLENSRDRIKGAAIDYNNLAETAFRKGQNDEAQKYLNLALTHAETLQDQELISYLKNKLSSRKSV